MKEVTKMIPFPPYDYRIYVTFAGDLTAAADKLAKKGKLSKDHEVDDTTAGFCVNVPNQGESYVVLKFNANINQVSHESYHALCGLFRWIGAKHEEELFAYHLGYLIDMIEQDRKDLTLKELSSILGV